jgi:hypothetical protein
MNFISFKKKAASVVFFFFFEEEEESRRLYSHIQPNSTQPTLSQVGFDLETSLNEYHITSNCARQQ